MFSVHWTLSQCGLGWLHAVASSIRSLTLELRDSPVLPLSSRTSSDKGWSFAHDDVAGVSQARATPAGQCLLSPGLDSGGRRWLPLKEIARGSRLLFLLWNKDRLGGHLTHMHALFEEYDGTTATPYRQREGAVVVGRRLDGLGFFCVCVCVCASFDASPVGMGRYIGTHISINQRPPWKSRAKFQLN